MQRSKWSVLVMVASVAACGAPEEETAPVEAAEFVFGGGFVATCRDVALNRNGDLWLNAHCGDGKGGWPFSAINLDAHIGNDDGRLVPGAKFSASCPSIGIFDNGANLSAACLARNGHAFVNPFFSLNACIWNDHGQLRWGC